MKDWKKWAAAAIAAFAGANLVMNWVSPEVVAYVAVFAASIGIMVPNVGSKSEQPALPAPQPDKPLDPFGLRSGGR